MLKNKNFILTVILPIFLSLAAGVVIISLNSSAVLKTEAATTIASEKKQMNEDMSKLKKEKKELSYKAAEYDKTIEENRLLLDELDALNNELNEYIKNIETAKATIAELDTSITEKTQYNESLNSLSGSDEGAVKSYTNVKLDIPSELKAGRYKAEGKGTLMIYTIAGTLQDKQNLSVLDTHSYTFDVVSGQSIKIEGTLSITQIIE